MPVDKYVYYLRIFTAFFLMYFPQIGISMAFKRTVLLSASSLFLLAGCGEGYEMVKTNTMFPYGNQRTAGSGVAYVLAKMMPEKELKLEPVAANPVTPKAVERDWKPEIKKVLPKTVAPEAPPAVPVAPAPAEMIFRDQIEK